MNLVLQELLSDLEVDSAQIQRQGSVLGLTFSTTSDRPFLVVIKTKSISGMYERALARSSSVK